MYSNVIITSSVKFEFEKDALLNCSHCVGSEQAMGKISPKKVNFFWDPRVNGTILSPQNKSQSTNNPLSCQRNYN